MKYPCEQGLPWLTASAWKLQIFASCCCLGNSRSEALPVSESEDASALV